MHHSCQQLTATAAANLVSGYAHALQYGGAARESYHLHHVLQSHQESSFFCSLTIIVVSFLAALVLCMLLLQSAYLDIQEDAKQQAEQVQCCQHLAEQVICSARIPEASPVESDK